MTSETRRGRRVRQEARDRIDLILSRAANGESDPDPLIAQRVFASVSGNRERAMVIDAVSVMSPIAQTTLLVDLILAHSEKER